MSSTLIICPHYPLPELTGANMRTMHFVRYFRRLGPVDIAHVHGGGDARPAQDGFREVIRLESGVNVRFRRRFALGILSGRPPQVYRYRARSRRAILARIISGDYDQILVRYLHCTGMLWALPAEFRRRVILDFDDILSGSLSNSWCEADAGLRKQALRSLLRHWIRRYEKKCLQFGATLVCSEADRAKLDDGAHRSPFVVPNVFQGGDELGAFTGDGFGKGHHLLFVGTMAYRPNVQGLRWFLASIFPTFRVVYPDATLTVVGRSPSADVRALCEESEGVNLHADVPDLRPFYRDARAVIVPLLAGGGTRIKILEAAAAGRPVLSTAIGAEGLALREGRDILIFRDAAEFLANYEHLAARGHYKSLVDGSRQILTRRYSPEAFDEALASVLAHLHERVAPAPGRRMNVQSS